MTANVLLYPVAAPTMPLHVPSSSDDVDFDPLPLDASDNGSAADLCIFTDLFLLSSSSTNNDDASLCKSKRKRPRRVSFQDEQYNVNLSEVINVPCFANLAEEERRGLWYRNVEIERFRSVARHACRALRKNPAAYPADITRGLELRTSLDRQYRKHLALTAIIKAQVRYPHIDPLHLAAIANRCTELPRKEALAQGTRDFCEAYYPNNNNNNNSCMSLTSAPLLIHNNNNNNMCANNFSTPLMASNNFPLHQAPAVVATPTAVDAQMLRFTRLNNNTNKRRPSVVTGESFQDAPVSKRRRFVATSHMMAPTMCLY